MSTSTFMSCRSCIHALKAVVSALSTRSQRRKFSTAADVKFTEKTKDALDKFGLWIGETKALDHRQSIHSLEHRLRDNPDILSYVQGLLDDLLEVAEDLQRTVAANAEEHSQAQGADKNAHEDEEMLLLEEVQSCIERLFQTRKLIYKPSPSPQDSFEQALSCHQQSSHGERDIAHVVKMFPKLASDEFAWLGRRLGRAITDRRRYLEYVGSKRENRDALGMESVLEKPTSSSSKPSHLTSVATTAGLSCRPKVSRDVPDQDTTKLLMAPEEDRGDADGVKDYAVISQWVGTQNWAQLASSIPRLQAPITGGASPAECPYCLQLRSFRREKDWILHALSDLRAYVCTFPSCEGLYFQNADDWFGHEISVHRIQYQCRLCLTMVYQSRERYLAHVESQHSILMIGLGADSQQSILDLARQSLKSISAKDCPCCYSWTDSIRAQEGISSEIPDHSIGVTPNTFKRHLGHHLAQLALYVLEPGSDTIEGSSSATAEPTVGATVVPSVPSTVASSAPVSSAATVQQHDQGASPGDAILIREEQGVLMTKPGYRAGGSTSPDDAGEDVSRPFRREDKCRELDEAILAARHAFEKPGEVDKAGLWSKLGNLLVARFEHSDKLVHLEEAIHAAEHALAATQAAYPERTRRIRSLADKLRSRFELTGEKSSLGAAMRLLQYNLDCLARRPPQDPEKLASHRALAMTSLSNVKPFRTIEQLEHEAVVMRMALGDKNQVALWSVYALAKGYFSQGRVADAVRVLTRVLNDQTMVLNNKHPHVLASRQILAAGYLSQGRLTEAIQMLERLTMGQKEAFGTEHRLVLVSQHTLAAAYQDDGRAGMAIRLYEHVIAAYSVKLERPHPPERIRAQLAVSRAYEIDGQLTQAVDVLQTVIQEQREVLGDETAAQLQIRLGLSNADDRPPSKLGDLPATVQEERLDDIEYVRAQLAATLGLWPSTVEGTSPAGVK